IETFGAQVAPGRYLDALSIDVEPHSNNVYITYLNLNVDPLYKALLFRISPDLGTTWPAGTWVGNDTTTTGRFLQVQCGRYPGEATFFWGTPLTLGTQIVSRSTSDYGATFTPVEMVRPSPKRLLTSPHANLGIGTLPPTTCDRTSLPSAGTIFYGAG